MEAASAVIYRQFVLLRADTSSWIVMGFKNETIRINYPGFKADY